MMKKIYIKPEIDFEIEEAEELMRASNTTDTENAEDYENVEGGGDGTSDADAKGFGGFIFDID